LVDEFSVIFEGAPIDDRDLPKMRGTLQEQFAEQLRSSTMLLRVELEKGMEEEEIMDDMETMETSSKDESVGAGGYLNIDISKKDVMVLSSTHIIREWILMGLFFLCSLIPMFVSFSLMTVVFSGMVLVIIYINAPRKDVITFDNVNKTEPKKQKEFLLQNENKFILSMIFNVSQLNKAPKRMGHID